MHSKDDQDQGLGGLLKRPNKRPGAKSWKKNQFWRFQKLILEWWKYYFIFLSPRIFTVFSVAKEKPWHIAGRGGKKYFLMFSKTSLNTNFWKVHRFLVYQKKLLQNLNLFWFYVVLNIAFLKETKVCMENSVIFGCFYLFSLF